MKTVSIGCVTLLANKASKRHPGSTFDIIDVLSGPLILRSVPGHVRSDFGPAFIAKAMGEWIGAVGAKTTYIAPFNAQPYDELLNGDIVYALTEAPRQVTGRTNCSTIDSSRGLSS